MDTIRQINKNPWWRKYWYLLLISMLIGITFTVKSTLGNASFMVNMDELVTATVEQGNFRVNVRATGVLKPLNIRWVSSQVTGRVEQVLVKPGAKVKQGEIILELSNPDLHRELEKARWELAATKAEYHAAYVVLESQMVDLENAVIAADYQYQSVKLKLDAETSLLSNGNSSVSTLDYQKSELAVKQQMQDWLAQQQKAQKMIANMAASKNAQLSRIGLVENNYQRVKEQVDALIIKASMDGVVQQVSLVLGQQAQVGDSVALIADQTSLFAELNVEEVRVRDIVLGQKVVIDTRTSEINGEVIRIDPAVNGGMVQVDIKLLSHLPAEARPELNIDGLIEVSNIDNAFFVRRPAFAAKDSDAGLYKLSIDRKFAAKTKVSLGRSSVNQIQILSGLIAGDKIIISDTSAWQEHKEIMIN